PARRHFELPRYSWNVTTERPRLRHRHRHRDPAFALLAMGQAGQGGALRLEERDPDEDRRDLRKARLYLGWQMVPLRYHALRIPPRADRGREASVTPVSPPRPSSLVRLPRRFGRGYDQ